MIPKPFRDPQNDFVVIDSIFPQKEPFAFRNSEINEYFKRVANFSSYSMYPMKPDDDAWFTDSYGVTHEQFLENIHGYLSHYPENKNRIHYLKNGKKYKFKLAYSYFLGETYTLLPFYEKYKIPFVFNLYPGGRFELNADRSDKMLRKIAASNYFEGTIVTQQITRDYLLDKKIFSAEKINYIYGGFVQFKKAEVKAKRFYKKSKKTFDICFVAAKYSEQGIDKGYDLFIETAKILCRKTKGIMFHVVGGFDESDVDVSSIKERIKFYGYKRPDFLLDFYSKMDIFLAPNRPFTISSGNFDGFPLGIDAGFCGVALFVADELKMNRHYKAGKEIVIVPLDAQKIAETILHYYNDPVELYKLSERGQVVVQKLFDIDWQTNERIKVFNRFVKLKLIN